MGRPRKKEQFIKPKMISARIEESDAVLFENLLFYKYRMKLQDFMSKVVVQFISGNLQFSGSGFTAVPPKKEWYE